MQQRERARDSVAEAGLVELLDRLDLALMQMPARPSVCRALSDLNYRLGAASPKPAGGSIGLHRRDVGTFPSSNPCRCFHDGEAANCRAI
jgi:hypothetical protein